MTDAPKPPSTKTVVVHFEMDEYDRLRTVAKAEKLPMTRLIRRVMDDHNKAVIRDKKLIVTSSAKTGEGDGAQSQIKSPGTPDPEAQ